MILRVISIEMINFGFWDKLKKPIMALAPMANVTDAAFRFIIAKYGKPDILWTEFVSCDGLVSSGKDRLLVDLDFSEIERPIIAQFFTDKPENMYQCALLAQELGFDGIDINMGCPAKEIEKQGAGAKLITTPKLAQEVLKAAQRGAGKLPVSVKTRLGFNRDIAEEWLPYLFECEPAAVTVHLRTRKEMSKVAAHWERMPDLVALRDTYFSGKDKPFLLGNGDLATLAEAEQKCIQTGCDGAMIGRGIFGNPWFFNKHHTRADISVREQLEVMLEHTRVYWDTLVPKRKPFDYMKKHYKAYVHGFVGASELREKLYTATDYNEIEAIVTDFLSNERTAPT
jgi:nifR3 family TIM-barrel protein